MKLRPSVISLLCLIVWIGSTSFAATRQELQAQTEAQIRAAAQKRNRMQSNLLLDSAAHLYYDGDRVYPGIVLNGVIYPARVHNGERQPGCLVNGRVIAGVYHPIDKLVVCRHSLHQVNKSDGQRLVAAKSSSASRPTAVKTTRRRQSKKQRPSSPWSATEYNPFYAKQKFGIRAGSWVRVSLARTISSSEPNEIELELLEDVQGSTRLLPAGTIFFARHQLNSATRRLDMKVSLMVLPTGEEFKISGTIHNLGRLAGLSGAIITHSEEVAGVIAQQNILEETKKQVARSIGNNPAARLAGSVVSGVVTSKQQALPPTPTFSVQVSPQEALLRFSRTF